MSEFNDWNETDDLELVTEIQDTVEQNANAFLERMAKFGWELVASKYNPQTETIQLLVEENDALVVVEVDAYDQKTTIKLRPELLAALKGF